MKKILIHSIAFSPDGVSTAYLYNDIALNLQREGFEVTVLTTTPHYNVVVSELEKQPIRSKFLGLYKVSNFKGIKVIHIPQKKFKSALLRMVGFAYWHFLALMIGVFGKKVDLILSPSPPLTIGLVNIVIAKIKGTKTIYNVQEIYPDLLIEQGGLKSKLVITILRKLERMVYNHSDTVTTIDQDFYNTIVERFEKPEKLHVIPNFVDVDIYKPQDVDYSYLNRIQFPESDRLKIMYAGNLGYAQDWETLLLLASRLMDFPADFYIVGEGVQKEYLRIEIQRRNLKNIKLLPYQERSLMPQLLAYSDLQFIFMDKKLQGHGFPSKVYTIMACAKPLLVSSGVNTPLHSFLYDKGCAFIDSQDEIGYKVENLSKFLRTTTSAQFKQMGENGLETIAQNYSSRKVCNDYNELITKMLL